MPWWWLGFFAWWATISLISLEIGGVVVAVGSTMEVGLIDIWFLQVVSIFGGLFEFWAIEKSTKFQKS